MGAAYYTSVSRLYDRLGALQSVTTLTSRQLFTAFIEPVESEISGYLARLYTVPVTSAPMIQGVATDLTYAKVLIEHVYTGQQLKRSDWPFHIRDAAMKRLRMVAEGALLLTDSAGTIIGTRTDVAQVTSNNMDYEPTFNEDGILDNTIDEDKLDDIADRRDIASDRWLI